MNTKHKPATALPFYCKGQTVYALSDEDVNVFSAYVQNADTDEAELQAIAAYICHASNAYPELVEALQTVCRQYENVRAAEGYESPSASVIFARALLSRLGEA